MNAQSKPLRSISCLLALILLMACAPGARSDSAANPGSLRTINAHTGLAELAYEVNPGEARYAHTGATLVRHVSVIDGMGNPVLEDRDLLLGDGRIVAIADGGTLDEAEGTLVIDGTGLTAMPGLMDLHTHFLAQDRFAGHKSTEARTATDVYRYKSYLYAYVYNGVTTILDAGTSPLVAGGLKSLIDEGLVIGPRFFWSGPILEGGIDNAAPGQYGSSDYVQQIHRSEDIPALVGGLQSMGADFIKLYRGTPLSMVARVGQEARQRGMRVWMDAWERTGTSAYARFGRLHGWAHLNFWFELSEADIADLVKEEHFAVTTFYALNAFSGRIYQDNPDYFDTPLLRNTLAPEFIDGMQAEMPDPLALMRHGVHHLAIHGVQDLMGMDEDMDVPELMREMSRIGGRNMKAMVEAGVLVGAGTDGGQGESTLTELELIVAEAGLSPLQAIQVATYNGARILQREDEFGSLREGLLADVLIVGGNPAEDIRDLRDIRYVFKEGKLVDRASLERQWGY